VESSLRFVSCHSSQRRAVTRASTLGARGPGLSQWLSGILTLGMLALLACHSTPSTSPAQAPPLGCCFLEGEWDITLTLDSAGQLSSSAPGTEISGRLHFSREFQPKGLTPSRAAEMTEEERHQIEKMEFARFEIDFSRFWEGGPLGPVASTTRLGEMPEPLSEALGVAMTRDTVGVLLNPQFTHGGLALAGRFESDSVVTGSWSVRGDRSGTGGRFRMHRRNVGGPTGLEER
jgi:hypothetical protein